MAVYDSLFLKSVVYCFMFVFYFKIRLEYDDGIMAHKLYGVGDKSTYMSLSQKRAEKSKQSKYSVSLIFRNLSFRLLKFFLKRE